jgi:hypothetical protein
MQINKVLTLALLAMLPLAGQAAIYKWVDEHGNVTYSAEKPPEAQAEKIRVNTQTRLDTGGSRQKTVDQKTSDSDTPKTDDKKELTRDEKKAAAAKKAASDKEKQAICDEARQTLTSLEAGGRIRQEDKDGNLTVMTEEQIDARVKREKERVAKYCK